MDFHCQIDLRRNAVRAHPGRTGLDYVEVAEDQRTLSAYFLGKLPGEFHENRPGIEKFLAVEPEGDGVPVRIIDVDPHLSADPDRDDYLLIRIDRPGDFSSYSLRLLGVANVDPHYERATFSFKVGCPSDLDCIVQVGCRPKSTEEPRINYLAKDYGSFRQLILDRLALVLPDWKERHAPDLGVTLVELLAYVGDHLSYYQDAVATEAYIDTARQRISVRRHARLVDYTLHEGCNARAWIQLETSDDCELVPSDVSFVTRLGTAAITTAAILTRRQLASFGDVAYEQFEPLVGDRSIPLRLRKAHNAIRFHTWGGRRCCLESGATGATLLDEWRWETEGAGPAAAARAKRTFAASSDGSRPGRALDIRVGDVLIFEEVVGTRSGIAADADPNRRHAVRVTQVTLGEDPLYPVSVATGDEARVGASLPTPVVEIRWAAEDALPFEFCLSTIGAPPACAPLTNVTVARGNVVLVDHGRWVGPEDLGIVPTDGEASCCLCEGEPVEARTLPGRYRPILRSRPLAHSEPLPTSLASAQLSVVQDPRSAVPRLVVYDDRGREWTAQRDLLQSRGEDRHLVAEIDNDGIAHLRFGDGESGKLPEGRLSVRYRIGGGTMGNVGRESIAHIVTDAPMDGISIAVRNPFAAVGGVEPETLGEARVLAPHDFRRRRERAVTAEDYAELASQTPSLQNAAARLAWTGSWYEASIAVDPLHSEAADDALLDQITRRMHRYRRIGHDLRVKRARYVPIRLTLDVCVRGGYQAGHVKAALSSRFGNRTAPDGTSGLFHPDNLGFGESIYVSRLVAAAQAVAGVECVKVGELRRLFAPTNQEIERGLLEIGADEIAQLDNDPSHPERGQLKIVTRGGR